MQKHTFSAQIYESFQEEDEKKQHISSSLLSVICHPKMSRFLHKHQNSYEAELLLVFWALFFIKYFTTTLPDWVDKM